MKNKIITSFKTLFFIGLILLFFSFFLDWYSFQIYDSTGLVVSWNYNLFVDWSTPLSNSSVFEIPALINITLQYEETTNYAPGYETHWLTVQDTISPAIT